MSDGETRALVVGEARGFAERRLDAARIERAGAIDRALLAEAGVIGLFGVSIPEAYGGLGLGLGGACAVATELARRDRAFATCVGLHAGLGTRGLVAFGAEALRQAWLPRLASGEVIASFAATEAAAGSDLAAVRTTGTVDGGALVLEGEKAYVTNGALAGVFTVLARTPGLGGARAHSLVLVPRDTPGVDIGREEDKLGIRASSTVSVRFERARVPLDHVLGAPGEGLARAYEVLGWGRTIMAAGCLGAGRAALDAALGHARTRTQFGKPLTAQPAVREHLATVAGRLVAIERVLADVARRSEAGASIERPSVAAKILASEGAWDAADRAVQLLGALGVIEDAGVARILRDVRVTRIFEGSNDVLLARLGATLLAERDDETPPLPSPATLPPELRGSVARLSDVRARLDAERARVRSEIGLAAARAQLLLVRLARAWIACFAASATAAASGDPSAPPVRIAAAVDGLCAEAVRALDAARRAGDDAARDAAVLEVLP